MKRRSFFKAFAALAATVVVAPSVLAKMVPDKKLTFGNGAEIWLDQNLNDYLEALTRYVPEDRMIFVGPKTFDLIHKMAKKQCGSNDQSLMGVRITNIRTTRGQWPILQSSFVEENTALAVEYPSPPPFFQVLKHHEFKVATPKIEWTRKDIGYRWPNGK